MKRNKEEKFALINFQGINCYYNSIATLVCDLGLEYKLLFADLWSECDLLFDEKSGLYLSKRLICNLEACGAKILSLRGKKAKNALERLKKGGKVAVCFDAFDVFWNSTYRSRHGSHYFIARKSNRDEFFIFDPTLDKKNIRISTDELAESSIDLFQIKKIRQNQNLKEELLCIRKEAVRAGQIIPQLKMKLIERVNNLRAGDDCIKFAKYCDSLTNNRFMFRHFVFSFFNPEPTSFMSDSYLLSFVAVKNGLYKLSLTGDCKTRQQIACLISMLLDKELKYAALLRET